MHGLISIRGLKAWFCALYFGALALVLLGTVLNWFKNPFMTVVALCYLAFSLVGFLASSSRKELTAYVSGKLPNTSLFPVWFIAFPLSLAASFSLGFKGIWLAIGLPTGLILAAGFLALHLVIKRRRETTVSAAG